MVSMLFELFKLLFILWYISCFGSVLLMIEEQFPNINKKAMYFVAATWPVSLPVLWIFK